MRSSTPLLPLQEKKSVQSTNELQNIILMLKECNKQSSSIKLAHYQEVAVILQEAIILWRKSEYIAYIETILKAKNNRYQIQLDSSSCYLLCLSYYLTGRLKEAKKEILSTEHNGEPFFLLAAFIDAKNGHFESYMGNMYRAISVVMKNPKGILQCAELVGLINKCNKSVTSTEDRLKKFTQLDQKIYTSEITRETVELCHALLMEYPTDIAVCSLCHMVCGLYKEFEEAYGITSTEFIEIAVFLSKINNGFKLQENLSTAYLFNIKLQELSHMQDNSTEMKNNLKKSNIALDLAASSKTKLNKEKEGYYLREALVLCPSNIDAVSRNIDYLCRENQTKSAFLYLTSLILMIEKTGKEKHRLQSLYTQRIAILNEFKQPAICSKADSKPLTEINNEKSEKKDLTDSDSNGIENCLETTHEVRLKQLVAIDFSPFIRRPLAQESASSLLSEVLRAGEKKDMDNLLKRMQHFTERYLKYPDEQKDCDFIIRQYSCVEKEKNKNSDTTQKKQSLHQKICALNFDEKTEKLCFELLFQFPLDFEVWSALSIMYGTHDKTKNQDASHCLSISSFFSNILKIGIAHSPSPFDVFECKFDILRFNAILPRCFSSRYPGRFAPPTHSITATDAINSALFYQEESELKNEEEAWRKAIYYAPYRFDAINGYVDFLCRTNKIETAIAILTCVIMAIESSKKHTDKLEAFQTQQKKLLAEVKKSDSLCTSIKNEISRCTLDDSAQQKESKEDANQKNTKKQNSAKQKQKAAKEREQQKKVEEQRKLNEVKKIQEEQKIAFQERQKQRKMEKEAQKKAKQAERKSAHQAEIARKDKIESENKKEKSLDAIAGSIVQWSLNAIIAELKSEKIKSKKHEEKTFHKQKKRKPEPHFPVILEETDEEVILARQELEFDTTVHQSFFRPRLAIRSEEQKMPLVQIQKAQKEKNMDDPIYQFTQLGQEEKNNRLNPVAEIDIDRMPVKFFKEDVNHVSPHKLMTAFLINNIEVYIVGGSCVNILRIFKGLSELTEFDKTLFNIDFDFVVKADQKAAESIIKKELGEKCGLIKRQKLDNLYYFSGCPKRIDLYLSQHWIESKTDPKELADLITRGISLSTLMLKMDIKAKKCRIYDYFGKGYEDAIKGRVNVIAHPDKSFGDEISNLIFRSLLYAAKRIFEIGSETSEAIENNKTKLIAYQGHVFNYQLDKLLCYGRGKHAIELLLKYGILDTVFKPIIFSTKSNPDVLGLCEIMEKIDKAIVASKMDDIDMEKLIPLIGQIIGIPEEDLQNQWGGLTTKLPINLIYAYIVSKHIAQCQDIAKWQNSALSLVYKHPFLLLARDSCSRFENYLLSLFAKYQDSHLSQYVQPLQQTVVLQQQPIALYPVSFFSQSQPLFVQPTQPLSSQSLLNNSNNKQGSDKSVAPMLNRR